MATLFRSDWFTLDAAELARYTEQAVGLPGVRVQRGISKRIEAIDLHISHLATLDPPLVVPMQASGTPRPAPYVLRDYQEEGIQFSRSRAGSLLLHALGMGKSAMALGALDTPAAVLCPTSAVPVWLLEAQQWGFSTQVLHGLHSASRTIRRNVDLYIITYGSAQAWLGYFRLLGIGFTLHTMIADEAQWLQHKALRWSQAFRSITRERTILLTATPLRNRLKSLWGLLDAAAPQAWGHQYDFRRRYCGAHEGAYGLVDSAPTNTDELALRLSAVTLRRTWDDPALAQYRPALERRLLDVEVDAASRSRVFEAAAEEMRASYQSRSRTGSGGSQLALMGRLRRQVGLLKAQWLSDRLGELLEEHKRIIFWVWHKENAEYLYRKLRELVKTDKVTGDSITTKRSTVIEEWQHGDHHEARALVTTLGAMSSAVNLTTADAAVFVEYDWAPLNVQQAEGRHHRHGSRYSKVYAYYLRVPGTIDERIAEVLLEKMREAEKVIGADSQTDQMHLLVDTLLDEHSDDDILTEAARRLIEEAV